MKQETSEWIEYLLYLEEQGLSEKEIRFQLLNLGCNEKFISKILKHRKEHIELKWKRYFDEARKRGYSYSEIGAHLIHEHSYENDLVKKQILNHRIEKSQVIVIPLAIMLLVAGIFTLITYEGMGPTGLVIHGGYDTTVSVNFSSSIGVVNDKLYGVNTHGMWGQRGSLIDTNGNGNLNAASDYEWHRQKLIEAGIGMLRADMYLERNFHKIPNKNNEQWITTSTTVSPGAVYKTNVPYAWALESTGGASGSVTRTTDSRTGQYAAQITNTGGTGNVNSHVIMYLPNNTGYNFNTWIKSSSNIRIIAQRMDNYAYLCSADSTGNNNWQNIGCNFDLTNAPEKGIRLVIEAGTGETAIWDDTELTVQGIIYNGTHRTQNINGADYSQRTEYIQWAHNNNMTMTYIVGGTSYYLADITAGCQSSPGTCPPTNNQEYAYLVLDYVDQVTQNGQLIDAIELEIRNEPDIHHWMADTPYNDPIRTQKYNELYKAVYDTVKAKYPTLQIGGMATAFQTTTNSRAMIRGWMQENNNKIDFISLHTYSGQDADYDIPRVINSMLQDCQDHNINCGTIRMSEYNVHNADIKLNNQAEYAKQLAIAYTHFLNTHPETGSLILYHWAEKLPYSAGAAQYPEYPQRWVMVAEPQLENKLFAPFHITKSFTSYHGPGSTVKKSTTTNNKIRIVASTKQQQNHITIINGDSINRNVNLKLIGINAEQITDLNSGISYGITNGTVTLNNLASNSVNHYLIIDNTIVPTQPEEPVQPEQPIEPQNTPPTIPSPTLVSLDGSYLENSSLRCTDSAKDPDGDRVNVTLEWIKNGAIQKTESPNGNYLPWSYIISVLDSSEVSAGNWTCRMQFSDGKDVSPWGSSATISIAAVPVPEEPTQPEEPSEPEPETPEEPAQPEEPIEPVDNIPPSVFSLSPSSGASILGDGSGAIIAFSWSATDAVSDPVMCNLVIDNKVVRSDVVTAKGDTPMVDYYASTGSHNWFVACKDEASNTGTSSARSFTVTAPPKDATKTNNGKGVGKGGGGGRTTTQQSIQTLSAYSTSSTETNLESEVIIQSENESLNVWYDWNSISEDGNVQSPYIQSEGTALEIEWNFSTKPENEVPVNSKGKKNAAKIVLGMSAFAGVAVIKGLAA